MKKYIFILCIILFLSWTELVNAVQIKVNARVSSQTIRLGESLQYIVDVIGESNVDIPHIEAENITIEYVGSGYSFYPINGTLQSDQHLVYSAKPVKTGKIVIPPVELNIKRKTYTTQSVEIEVKEALDMEPLKDQIFIRCSFNKSQIFSSEQVLFEVHIYVPQWIELKNVDFAKPQSSLFLMNPFERDEPFEDVIEDQKYTVIPFKTVIQPFSTGLLILEPFSFQAQVREKPSTNEALLNSLLDRSYNFQTISMTISEQTIHVLDLPTENRPSDFKGAIGNFSMKVSLQSEYALQGEPLIIRTHISGEGNFSTVNSPYFAHQDNFLIYEPKLVTENESLNTNPSERIYELTIVPKEVVSELPELKFTFFEPVEGKYITLSELIKIKVHAEDKKGETVFDYGIEHRQNSLKEGEGIYKIASSRLYQLKELIIKNYVLVLSIIVTCISIYGAYVSFQWMKANKGAKYRSRISVDQALKKLNDIMIEADQGDPASSFKLVYAIAQTYFKERFDIIITGVSQYEEQILCINGLTNEQIVKIKAFCSELNTIIFSKMNVTKDDITSVSLKLSKLIEEIESQCSEKTKDCRRI